MGLVNKIKRELRDTTGANLAYPPLWLRNFVLGIDSPTQSGVNVNENTAVKMVAVYACIRLLSESIAMLPLPLYKRLKVGKEKAEYHPIYSLIHDMPNPEVSSFTFRQIMMVNALLMPQAYAEIEYNGGGQPIALWPIPSNRVRPYRDPETKNLVYFVQMPDSGETVIRAENMFILPGMGFSSDSPFKPIELAREAIGLGMATEAFGAKFFGNGTNASGIIEYPGRMSDESYNRYKASFNENYSGLNNAQRLIFLEQGLKFTQLTIPPDSAQFLETRKFQVIEIARFFNVPPHMIMDFDGATFSNIEQKSLEYVTYSLMPWLVKWEQAIYKDLISTLDKKKFYVKFSVDALLRGDFQTRMNGYHLMIQDGIFNADEVRELEDMNPQPDGQGGVYLCNGNMIPKSLAGTINVKGGDKNGEGTQSQSGQGSSNNR